MCAEETLSRAECAEGLPRNASAAASATAFWESIELLTPPDFEADERTHRWRAGETAASGLLARDAWTKLVLEGNDIVLDLNAPAEQLRSALPVFRVMVGVVPKRAYYAHLMRMLRVPGTETGDVQEMLGLDNVRGDVFLASFELNPWGRLVPESFDATGAVGVLDHLRLLRRLAELEPSVDADAFSAADAAARIDRVAERFYMTAAQMLGWAAPARRSDFVAERTRLDEASSGAVPNERAGAEPPKLVRFANVVPGKAVGPGWIEHFARRLAERMGWDGAVGVAVRVEHEHPSRVPEPRRDLLGSFYLSDLAGIRARLEGAVPPGASRRIGAPLRRLFDGIGDLKAAAGVRRDVLRDPSSLAALLSPVRLPSGRWPLERDVHLFVAQQAAVSLLAGAGEGPASSRPDHERLLAVNGPPGTGKSFILRDLVAEVVVARARRLAALKDASELLDGAEKVRFIEHEAERAILVPKPEVTSENVIIVASNNNAAIRNITDDLPRAFTLKRAEAFEYWKEPAGAFLWAAGPGKGMTQGAGARQKREQFVRSVWGLVSATLGRASNCAAFVRTVLARSARRDGRSDRADDPMTVSDRLGRWTTDEGRAEARAAWIAARDAFLDADRRLSADREAMTARSAKISPSVYSSSLEAHPEQHKTSVWVDGAFEAHRSELFLAALTLHRATLQADASRWIDNLVNAGRWLTNPGAALLEGRAGGVLETLSMLVPVISTTLASAGRLLRNVGAEEIGWVLVDEASQATPASALGLLDRARRAVVIGDTRQLSPIVPMPARLCEHLRRRIPGVAPVWSPQRSSLQRLADLVMPWGTTIHDAVTGEDVWTGFPLRAHLRCQSPMFDIANAVSYGGQMVQMTPRRDAARLEFSCWIDVEETGAAPQVDIGSAIRRGKVNPTEIAVLEGVLRGLLRDASLQKSSLFIVSPFRSVADAAQRLIEAHRWEDRLRADTVHSFQGQEADVVVLVLGSTPGSPGRLQRRWAAQPANLINVAVTRAKSDLIVIGSMRDWCAEPLFAIVARLMRRGVLRPGALFSSAEEAHGDAVRQQDRAEHAFPNPEGPASAGLRTRAERKPSGAAASRRAIEAMRSEPVSAAEAKDAAAEPETPKGDQEQPKREAPAPASAQDAKDPLAALSKPIDDLPWTW